MADRSVADESATEKHVLRGEPGAHRRDQAVLARPELRTQRRLSHVFRFDVPSYHKPLLVTDAAKMTLSCAAVAFKDLDGLLSDTPTPSADSRKPSPRAPRRPWPPPPAA